MIYYLWSVDRDEIKIGFTRVFHSRLVDLELEFGKLNLMGWEPGNVAYEHELHDRFAIHHTDREFFLPVLDVIQHIEENTCKTHPDNIYVGDNQSAGEWWLLERIDELEDKLRIEEKAHGKTKEMLTCARELLSRQPKQLQVQQFDVPDFDDDDDDMLIIATGD